jgi:squalene-hopene/tetraprenyl-beta-curcumene cyclase
MQCKNGGWASFDRDNTKMIFQYIPFADHNAMLDPPTVDITGRMLEMLANYGYTRDDKRVQKAIEFILREQEPDGSWFGRWGVNYIYGTWSVLCALNVAAPASPMIASAADWLVRIQNPDGGWGEDCDSYKLDYQGHESAPSAASQTAWAVLGLMAAGRTDDPAVTRGVEWLKRTQDGRGEWPEDAYTGGGFPRVFYLRYHGYAKFFPLWALARYRNLTRANDPRPAWGM